MDTWYRRVLLVSATRGLFGERRQREQLSDKLPAPLTSSVEKLMIFAGLTTLSRLLVSKNFGCFAKSEVGQFERIALAIITFTFSQCRSKLREQKLAKSGLFHA